MLWLLSQRGVDSPAVLWPPLLADVKALREGYKESPGDTRIRTKMDVGADKVRPRTSAGVGRKTLHFIMSKRQTQVFDDFFNNTLMSGSLVFARKHERTGYYQRYRFLGVPTMTPRSISWLVVCEFEVLP